MPNRREFLRKATCASGTVFRLGLAGVFSQAFINNASITASARAPGRTFRGVIAGEQREVDAIRLCWCPPGRFVMGSPPDEPGHRADEAQVEVTLTRGFWISKFEVTQAQWIQVVGQFPDKTPSSEFGEGDDFPVYWVNFDEAEDFCSKMTKRAHLSGALPAGWEFRLPTEAQWEYACRAGTVTATSFGDELGRHQANFGGESLNAGRSELGLRGARRVGSYPANRWGICDMHGNVWEWCRDWYHARLPGGNDPDLRNVKGVPNRDGTYSRARRGGAWIEPGWACRSACRLRYESHRRSDHIGFRVGAVES